jgi:Fic family protein
MGWEVSVCMAGVGEKGQPISCMMRRTRETLANAEAVALTGANRSTLKAKFAELIAVGLVEAHGKGRGVYYCKKRG